MSLRATIHRGFWAVLFIAGLSLQARGADEGDKKSNYAAIDLTKVDADFPFQGEFNGQIWGDLEHRIGRNIALQVIARGAGQFDAKMFDGGFPGLGWDGMEPTRLKGKLGLDGVDLHGDGYHIVVTDRFADFYYINGLPLGQIPKIMRVSPTDSMLPPWNAKVLFHGYDTENFAGGRISRYGYLMQGTDIKEFYKDYTLHIEFMLPYMPYARGQGRGNSGVYLQSRYEVQILDSFGLEGEFNECGALYRFRKPDANMCYPPLTWQTYDIVFNSPRFDADGKKIENAHISVYHNGMAVHHNVDLERKTGGGAPEGPDLLPIKLQDHGNPVRFRNIWIIDDTKQTIDPYPHYVRPDVPWRPWGMNVTKGQNLIQHGYPFDTN
jgi:hypothetical protein